MSFSEASKRLAKEYPEFAFTAEQLRRMARRRVIPSIEIPTCGTCHQSFHKVCYDELVAFFQTCKREAIA